MSKGWLAGEYIAAGIEQAGAGARAAAAGQAHLDDVTALARAKNVISNWNAGNLAEKQALREALRKLDPKHPLLVNTDLQERIKAAGQRAYGMTDDWNAAREAGGTFNV